MRILVTGSSGMVGSALLPRLVDGGHEVLRLVRREPAAGEVFWDPGRGQIDASGLAGLDAVVHLAGENVAARRWTPAQKERIRRSRVEATELLCGALEADPPGVFVGASAIGYYGDRGDEELTEDSPPGSDFLAEVCVAWEKASRPLEGVCRVVRPRIGVVLGPGGGALSRMLPLFRLGLGGRLGSGRQFVSWVSIEDLVEILLRAVNDASMRGPCNATAPNPVRNAELTRALARRLHRPAILPAPAFALRLAMGEMADALLLSSTRALPARLLEAGFEFRHPDIDTALAALVQR